MPYPRRVTEDDIERLREVAQARRAPSDKALASELGISVRAVQYWMAKLREHVVSSRGESENNVYDETASL